MKNKILYFEGSKVLDNNYKGEPVYVFNFIDLETIERLSFGQCSMKIF